MDWSGSPIVRERPGVISGMPALRDDPRVPPETVVVNMDEGMTAMEVREIFGLQTPLADIEALYSYAKALHVADTV